MADFVLDASALLAIAFNEPGADIAISRMAACSVSAVNYSEASAKMIDKGFDPAEATGWLDALALDIVAFDRAAAARAAALRPIVGARRLSFADRACIALAADIEATAVTTDRAWADIGLPCTVELIR